MVFDTQTKISHVYSISYEFFWNTTAAQFRDKMLKEYQSFGMTPVFQKQITAD